MENRFLITHYYHSGFSVSCRNTLLIFDYWRGEQQDLPLSAQINTELLQRYQQVYVFISHEHPDHFDPVVYEWKTLDCVRYIVSSDMPVGTRGKRMAPGYILALSADLSVTAFPSTDLGVSFLVRFYGVVFFHAGDLNFWHWRDESSASEIADAEKEFNEALSSLSGESIDIAFFPVDPRQGTMYEAGANSFILSIKPKLLIPMHYFHREDAAIDFSRLARNRSTEVIPMTDYGSQILIDYGDEGKAHITILTLHPEDNDPDSTAAKETNMVIDDNNPFAGTEAPVILDKEKDGSSTT